MITPIKCYILSCDSCNEEFDINGFGFFSGIEEVKEAAAEAKWYVHHKKCYCPNCHNVDEDGNPYFFDEEGRLYFELAKPKKSWLPQWLVRLVAFCASIGAVMIGSVVYPLLMIVFGERKAEKMFDRVMDPIFKRFI